MLPPHSSKPIGQAPGETPLRVVTETVWLMIEIGGERVEIDINRLLREPFWSISLHSKHEGEVILTRNPEIEQEFARFSLTIGKTVDAQR